MARSEVNYIFDAETAFRAPGAAAVTAAGVIGSEIALDKMVNVRPSSQRNKLGAQGYDVVIAVSAAAFPGAEEYTFNVETGAAGAAATVVGSVKIAGTGQYVIKLDAETIEKMDANHAVLELNLVFADVATTNESITFAAWVV